MQLLEPLSVERSAPLASANPLAKLGAATILMLALFVTTDLLTPALLVTAELGSLPATGIRAGAFLRRSWPLLVAAAGIGLFNALLPAQATGQPLVAFGPLQMTTDSLLTGAALAMRLIGIAIAGVLAVATTDPTELTDALVQQLHLSPRFAVGGLAAYRLLPLFAREWQTMRLARRARGVEAGRSPIRAGRLFAGQMLTLLVGAVRRGTRLAVAMEARGFGARPCRTTARPQHMRVADWMLIGAAAALAAAATAVSVAAGTWRFLFA